MGPLTPNSTPHLMSQIGTYCHVSFCRGIFGLPSSWLGDFPRPCWEMKLRACFSWECETVILPTTEINVLKHSFVVFFVANTDVP